MIYPLLFLKAATPEIETNSFDAVIYTQDAHCAEVRVTRFLVEDAAYLPHDSPNTSLRFALEASNVSPVDESPTCSVPAL